MIKLRIIAENIKELYDGFFVSDYVGNIRDYLIKKPKPYRVVYDSKNDIYAIADAEKYDHSDMIKNIVKSGYMYEQNPNFESEMDEMRDHYSYSREYAKYDDASMYLKSYLDRGYILGLMIIPNNYDYFKYEKSGFYKAETNITTGTIYTKQRSYFSPTGYFRDLYNSLNRFGEILNTKKSLDDIYKNCERAGNKADIEWAFKLKAKDCGYGDTEIFKYLQKLPGNTLEDLWVHYKRMYKELAPQIFFHYARKYGYMDDEINDYLEFEVGVDRVVPSSGRVYYD
jgi:hypothetical protein